MERWGINFTLIPIIPIIPIIQNLPEKSGVRVQFSLILETIMIWRRFSSGIGEDEIIKGFDSLTRSDTGIGRWSDAKDDIAFIRRKLVDRE